MNSLSCLCLHHEAYIWCHLIHMIVFALIIIIGYETISADPLAVRGSAPRSLCKGDGRDFFGATRILLLFECFEGAVPRHLGAGSCVFFEGGVPMHLGARSCVFLMDSKGNVKHFFGARSAWSGHESCCCWAVPRHLGAGSCDFFEGGVPMHLGAGSCAFLMDSKGDVKHFFGARFAWLGHESCCCSRVSKAQLQGI